MLNSLPPPLSVTVPTIGLIGCGAWGQRILTTLVRLQVPVLAIDPDPRQQAWATQLGAIQTTGQLAGSHPCDAYMVATPATTHRTILTKLAPYGKPIFVEKPLATTHEDTWAVAQLALPPTFMMHIWCYHPGIQLLGKLARQGDLGTLTYLRTTRTNWTSPRTDTDTAWTLLPHDLTIVLAILGELPPPRACITERHNGVVRGVTALLGTTPAVALEVSTRYADKRREVRLHGTAGVAVLANEQVDYLDIWWGDDRSAPETVRHERLHFDPTPPLELELKAFLHYLQGGPPPISSLAEGVQVGQVIDELLRLSA